MIDSGPISAPPALLADRDNDLHSTPTQSMHVVEERLRRLEDAVAALQERRPVDSALCEPAGLTPAPPPAPDGEAGRNVLLDTGARLLPLAVSMLHRPPIATVAPAQWAAATPRQRRPWLLFDTLDELRLIVHMFSDKRYRVGWVTILVPLFVFFLMIASSMSIGGLPVVGSTLDKVVDLLLSFFVYKVLTREAHRYREAAAILSGTRSF